MQLYRMYSCTCVCLYASMEELTTRLRAVLTTPIWLFLEFERFRRWMPRGGCQIGVMWRRLCVGTNNCDLSNKHGVYSQLCVNNDKLHRGQLNCGIPTHDTLQSRWVLYQLSYQGNSAGRGSNLQHNSTQRHTSNHCAMVQYITSS